MKKLILVSAIISSFMFATTAVSGEVTDTEWNIIDRLIITYYSGSSTVVECTVFNSKNSPIGGGESYPSGGVARVSVQVPTKYVRASGLTLKCN